MANPYLSQIQSQKQLQILAPQLRQSLELLQVPILELRALIEQEIQQNPTLDELPSENNTQLEMEPGKGGEKDEPDGELDFSKEFEVLAKLDDEWRDYFKQTYSTGPQRENEEEKYQFMIDSLSISESLQEHLLSQLAFTGLSEEDRRIGELIIGSIDEDGFLALELDDLALSTGYQSARLEDVLLLIQTFDPIGVGARSLSECLLLQIRRLGMEESLEAEVAAHHLNLLGSKKYPDLARLLHVEVSEVSRIAEFIGTLEPKPGRRFSSESATYVSPEIAIKMIDGAYQPIMNNDALPRLRISNHYRKLMDEKSTTKEVKKYIHDKVQAGAFLIKSIDQRQQTIRRIAEEIIAVQTPFFDEGVSKLKPLTMSEVADKIGVHETTVSRAIANKYMQTPQGVYDMKYFFTPGFKSADGESMSNKAIKDAIAQLVANEPPTKPLSDQAMVNQLKEKGIKVARRTIAKYREELQILPSHLRKQF